MASSRETPVQDAVGSLCDAYHTGLIPNAIEDSRYYNIRTMQAVKLRTTRPEQKRRLTEFTPIDGTSLSRDAPLGEDPLSEHDGRAIAGVPETHIYQRYNLGCGNRFLEGFVNINSGWNVLLSKVPWIKQPLFSLGILPKGMMTNLDKRIRYGRVPGTLRKIRDSSSDRICSSHLIEHLSRADGIFMLKECFRILCPDGILRIVAPDGARIARYYLENTEACVRDERESTVFRDYLFDNIAGGLTDRREKNAHRFLWDIPSMKSTLRAIGFRDIKICNYQESERDPAMAMVDNHRDISFFLEAVKPSSIASERS